MHTSKYLRNTHSYVRSRNTMKPWHNICYLSISCWHLFFMSSSSPSPSYTIKRAWLWSYYLRACFTISSSSCDVSKCKSRIPRPFGTVYPLSMLMIFQIPLIIAEKIRFSYHMESFLFHIFYASRHCNTADIHDTTWQITFIVHFFSNRWIKINELTIMSTVWLLIINNCF